MDFHISAGYISNDILPLKLNDVKLKVTSNCDKVILVGKFYRIIREDTLESCCGGRVAFDVAITFDNFINIVKIYKKLCIIIEDEDMMILFKKDITNDDICEGSVVLSDKEVKFLGPVCVNMVCNYTPIPTYSSDCHKYYVCEEVDSITIFENGNQLDTRNYIFVNGDYSYLPIEIIAVNKSKDNFNVEMKFERLGYGSELSVTKTN